MHLTRNQAYLYGYRGFESLPLRHVGPAKHSSKKDGPEAATRAAICARRVTDLDPKCPVSLRPIAGRDDLGWNIGTDQRFCGNISVTS